MFQNPVVSQREWVPLTVADPGFPRGGGSNPQGGRQDTILLKFPENGMKLKKIRPPGRGHASPAPPLRSATDCVQHEKDDHLDHLLQL